MRELNQLYKKLLMITNLLYRLKKGNILDNFKIYCTTLKHKILIKDEVFNKYLNLNNEMSVLG
jgi:hypothetical protein